MNDHKYLPVSPLILPPHLLILSFLSSIAPPYSHAFVYASILQGCLFIIMNCLFIIAMIMLNTEISFLTIPSLKSFFGLCIFSAHSSIMLLAAGVIVVLFRIDDSR